MKTAVTTFALAVVCALAGAAEPPDALQAAVREDGTGAIVGLSGLDPLVAEALPISRTVSGGKMIYCGSPEYCPGPGVLYRDEFSAGTDVRLYLYHVNASASPLRFSVILEPVDGPAVVDLKNSIVIGPSMDYFGVGRLSSFIQLGRPTPPEPIRLAVNGVTVLDPDMDRRVVPPGRVEPLIHSLHDFRVVSGRVRVSTVAVEEGADTVSRYPGLAQLPRDKNHDRGTYNGLTIDLTGKEPYSTKDGVRHIRLADGKADAWLDGGDNTLPRKEPYRGSYGVIYRVHLKLRSPDGRSVALLLNPRAGNLAGAVAVAVPRHGKTASYVPALGSRPVSEKEEAVILGKWNPRTTPEVTILWTPPGAASLPVEWLLVPYSEPAHETVRERL